MNQELKEPRNKNVESLFIFYYLTIILISSLLSIKCKERRMYLSYSYITLKVNKTGNLSILSDSFKGNNPVVVIINNNTMNVQRKYDFNNTDNEIILVWDSDLNTAYQMFYACYDISEIDLSNLDTSHVTNMAYMFYHCHTLTSVNFSNINSSCVTNMALMFAYCSKLTILDLSNIDTSNVINMESIFSNCVNLEQIIMNFDTSQVEIMNNMFYSCSSLTSLNLSNFNTSKVTSMRSMFAGCKGLTELNLNHFDTSQVLSLYDMFEGCSYLKNLDLSNFNTTKVTNMAFMFRFCSSLIVLNLTNFDTSAVRTMQEMFSGCSSLIILNISNFITSKVTNMYFIFNECSKLSSLDLSSFNTSLVINVEGMFRNCKNIANLNITNFDTSKVRTMSYMFNGCSLLESLDLSSFVTSNVETVSDMFFNCAKLIYLNLDNFDTSQIISMAGMFTYCQILTSLDLSHFNTSKVKNMCLMFYGCYKLTYLNLTNFNTSNVVTMASMFWNLQSLSSLDLSSFDTSKVTNMWEMFRGCSTLTSLDLSNFDTSNVKIMNTMFTGCSKLSTLNVSNFNTSNVTIMISMFSGCLSLTSLDLSHFDTSHLTNIETMFNRCSNLTYINFKIATIKNDTLTTNIFNLTPKTLLMCSMNIEWIKYFDKYQRINCINYFSNNTQEFYCFFNNSIEYNKYQCDICGDNYYLIYNDSTNNESFINCYYEHLNGYYLDQYENISLYKSCYKSCEKCEFSGNKEEQNCTKCKNNDGYLFELNTSAFKNCYKKCSHFYYYDMILNKYYCTKSEICPENYDKLIIENRQCINNCSEDAIYKYNFENYCLNESQYNLIKNGILNTSILVNNSINFITDNTIINSHISEISEELIKKNYTNIINTMFNINYSEFCNEIITYENDIKENKFELIKTIIENLIIGINITKLEIEKYQQIIDNNLKIIITSLYNQKFNEPEDDIIIDLKECEDILKTNYNISKNNSLYILKLIKEEKGMKIPKVEYEVYYPLYNIYNLTKLNLALCKGTKVEISIPVKINDTLDKYNSSSDYYNDICSKTTSKYNTDISLKDRRNEFIDNNMTLCEEKCKLIEYNYDKEQAKCSCDVKLNIPLFEDIKFNKDELYKSFTDIKRIANLEVMKCFKNVFNKSLIKNYGFFILAFVILFYFVCLFIFIFKSYQKIIVDINDIVSALKNLNKKFKKVLGKKKRKRRNKNIKSKELKLNDIKEIKLKENNGNEINNQITLNIKNDNTLNNNFVGNDSKKNILDYKDFELNLLEYSDFVKLDKRSYSQFYISLLKNNHPLFFSFLPNKDYNSLIIKIFLFFFSFIFNLVFNSLFF